MSPVSLLNMSVSWAALGKLVLAGLVAAILRVLYLIYDTFIARVRTDPIKVLPGLAGTRFANQHGQFLEYVFTERFKLPMLSSLQRPENHQSTRQPAKGAWSFIPLPRNGLGTSSSAFKDASSHLFKHDLRFVTFDYRAATHIFNSPNYERPWQTRDILRSYFQDGGLSRRSSLIYSSLCRDILLHWSRSQTPATRYCACLHLDSRSRLGADFRQRSWHALRPPSRSPLRRKGRGPYHRHCQVDFSRFIQHNGARSTRL